MKKILIADDDAAICDSVCMVLEEEGYIVSSTLDGKTVRNMKVNFPDLLLLDIWMSGEDGREICKKLKSQKVTNHIPIIMLSASRDIVNSAKEAGADDFLSKPFKIDDLLEKIEKYLIKKT